MSPVPRLIPERTACIVIDVQECLLPVIADAARLISRCAFLLEIAGHLGIPCAITEQYVAGLGATAPAVRAALPASGRVIHKTRFSGCVSELEHWLADLARPSVLVAGIEAHVCVLQTSLDLLDLGYQVFLVSDAISGGEREQIQPAIRRIERAGGITTGCVSMTYELLGDSGHPVFKRCLELVRRIRADNVT